MKVYIACGLTHVPRELFHAYSEFIHSMASALSTAGFRQVRYALMHSDPPLAEKPFAERARLCYLWDRDMVEEADLIVAEATYPSTGLGIELQLAQNKETPIILCFHKVEQNRVSAVEYENPDHLRHTLQIGEGYISLMALGLPAVFRVIEYQDPIDGIARIVEAAKIVDIQSM